MITAVITGMSSLESARERTPPTALVRPSLANSRVNWIVKTMPTKHDVRRQTLRDLGPTLLSCSSTLRR